MRNKHARVRWVSGLRNLILPTTAVLLLGSLLSSPAYGCKVKDVFLHIGQTETEAKDETYVNKTVCCTFYWYLRWTADSPDTNTFTIVWEIYNGAWEEWFKDENVSGDKRGAVLEVTGSEAGPGTRKVRGKVKRNDVGDEFHTSNSSTATVIEVSSVDTDPSGTSVVCTNQSVTFEATTSSGGNYDMVDWSGGGTPSTKEGSQTFTTKWATTGMKTVKACCADSCKEYEIDVIDGLTVLPHEAYVCVYDTKEFEAWVCEGGVAVQKTSTDGVEWSASNGTFTGDTYDPDDVSESVGGDTVTASFDGDEDSAVVTNFECDVTSADVCEDNIHVDLGPPGLSGTLLLELTGPAGSHTILEETRESGSYDETFDVPNLPVGEYTQVEGTWSIEDTPCTDEYPYHIQVLGDYDHTCYNTPDEAGCAGELQWFSYTTGDCVNVDCVWTNAQGRSEWLDEVEENGSGMDLSGHVYSLEHFCTGNYYSPALRRTGVPCAQCGGTVSEGDVAVQPNHPYLGCSDRVCVHGHGIHTVVDTGSGVAETQLDHYTGVSACNVCNPPGDNIMTIKLF